MAHESPAQTKTVERVMHEFNYGALKSAGKTVRSPRTQEISVKLFGGFVLLGVLAGTVPVRAQQATKAAPDSSGPQMAVPAPLPAGTADVPGGSARNGVIKPPASAGAMPIVQPPVQGSMPVIPPPGTPTNAPHVQPK